MGLIRAAVGSVGGTLADSWLDYIAADNMTETTIMTRGVQVSNRRGSNKKGNADVISNGSKIVVGPKQMMILMDGGRIVDYTAEEGYYEVYLSSSPSLFNGELKASVRETFERFKFGGQPGKSQQVYFLNLQEIRGIKFGTRNALQYFDNFYNAELFVRCHGTFSVKITDPLKFFMESVPHNAQRLDFAEINAQYTSEFLTALQSAIGQMSVDGVRISSLPAKSMELAKYMSNVLDDDWNQNRGMEIASALRASAMTMKANSSSICGTRARCFLMRPFGKDTYRALLQRACKAQVPIQPAPVRHTWQWVWACRAQAALCRQLLPPMRHRCSSKQQLPLPPLLYRLHLLQRQVVGLLRAERSTRAISVPTAATKSRLRQPAGLVRAEQSTRAISAPTAAARSRQQTGPVPAER